MFQNYSVHHMFEESQKFYEGLGFEPLSEEFFKRSIMTHPLDRAIVCVPAAIDFRDGKDFRLVFLF